MNVAADGPTDELLAIETPERPPMNVSPPKLSRHSSGIVVMAPPSQRAGTSLVSATKSDESPRLVFVTRWERVWLFAAS